MWHNWIKYLKQASSPAPLVVFRILFGCLMVFTTVRFVANGWVEKFYVEPQFFFKYYGFDFVKSLGYYTYLLFLGTFISGLGIMLGYYYRISAIIFFLCFTYIELIDKTVYLNHYYFISLISFLLIFLPANCYFSIDARRCPQKAFSKIPRYYVWIIPLLLCIVYFYAGLAKLNSDWLFKAMPLAIWLPAKYDIPILGDWLQMPWVHYFFSWAGMFYDLSISFLLIYKRTRVFAFFFSDCFSCTYKSIISYWDFSLHYDFCYTCFF